MRRSLDEIEQRSKLEAARDGASEQLGRARQRLEPLRAERAEALAASLRFNAALAEVYRDPAAARREFDARARRDGIATTSAEIAKHPERFGSLRGAQVGPIRSADRSEAVRSAAKLEHLGAEHRRQRGEARASREPYRAAKREVVELETKLARLDSELARGIGCGRLRHGLNREIAAIHPDKARVFQRSLPIPQRRILSAAMVAAQSFAREQGHER